MSRLAQDCNRQLAKFAGAERVWPDELTAIYLISVAVLPGHSRRGSEPGS
jgi:hypothetical protein